MRADRLLSIMLTLQVHRRMTAAALAKQLEVSARTIHRDMEALGAAGVPVYAERGAGGGWILDEAFRTDLTGLTEAEVRALFLSSPPRLLADLGLERASDAALVKLLAALPAAGRRGADYVRQRIHVDAASWRGGGDAVPSLAVLLEAIWRERKVRFAYRRTDGGEAVERVVDPLGLVAKGSTWYLVAGLDGELRTYRVSRVEAAAVTEQPCVRPPGFDLADHWARSSSAFLANLPRYPVTVRVAPVALRRLWIPGSYAQVEQVGEPEADGWRVVRLLLQTADEACSYVLGFGTAMAVVEPAELRARVIGVARDLVTFYARSTSQAEAVATEPPS